MSTTTAATVLAKIAGLSTAGKAALGLAVAAGAVGVATAVPAIADPQDDPGVPVPSVSATADPTTEPTADPTAEPSEEPTTEPSEEPTAEPTEEPGTAPTDLPAASAFGQAVAEDARDGGVVGPEIAALAHERNEARAEARDEVPEAVPTPEEAGAPEPGALDAQP